MGKGRMRLDFSPTFWSWDSRYGYRLDETGSVVEEVEPLSFELATESLGSGAMPILLDLEEDLRGALLDSDYRVRLGEGKAVVGQSHLTFPFRLEVGVLDWLTLGVMVPLERPRTEMDFFLQADSLNADVGLSPQVTAPNRVGSFVNQFGEALALAEEANPGDPALAQARAFLESLAAAYNRATVFPSTGSVAGANLQSRLDALRAELEARGIGGIPQEVPLADGLLDEEGFASLFSAPRVLAAYPLEDWTTPWTLGDVEISTAVRLLRRGFTPDSAGALAPLRYQIGVGGLLRLGTGGQGDPNRFYSRDPSHGQMDLEGTAFGLVEVGHRLGGWGEFRYGLQTEGSVVRRIATPAQVLPDVFTRAPLDWTPGNYLELQLNPHYFLTPDLTLGLRYRYWNKGADSYALGAIDPEILAVVDFPSTDGLESETEETLQEGGFNLTYSTLKGYERGETGWPLTIRATFLFPMSGSGGGTPKGPRFQVGLSLYRTLWGSQGRGHGGKGTDPGSGGTGTSGGS